MELVDSAISRPNCEDLSLFSRRFLIPAAQPEMKLDLRAPCWITARRRNRELNCTLYIRTVLSFRFVSFQRPRFHVEALGIAKERERERERETDKEKTGKERWKKKKKKGRKKATEGAQIDQGSSASPFYSRSISISDLWRAVRRGKFQFPAAHAAAVEERRMKTKRILSTMSQKACVYLQRCINRRKNPD